MKPQTHKGHKEKTWLALMIGNSRLHWALFVGENLQSAWDTPHLPASVVYQLAKCQTLGDLPVELVPPSQLNPKSRHFAQRGEPPHTSGSKIQNPKSPLPLLLASVVPSQTVLWQAYPDVHAITLDQVPLQGVYPTLGIDRALALWGAGETWGLPILVIDAGTALTLTGADANRQLVGGAILPGLSLQFQSLAQRTAGLPLVDLLDITCLPERWALNTPEAIQSGVLYTLIAGIRDFINAWWQKFPGSSIVLTGGDRTLLLKYLQSQFPEVASRAIADPHLIFWGIRSYFRGQD
ncbi:pantothenate kinase [Chroococcidiopsis sp. CCMEE 29]|uniref:pantothenate kinase n=1 Tax=Chroococcidiopsis sp. CCMEE 29 TaxID=155894 RepID=UPI0020224FD1|nr:pantothenate kinase [Chroococcidiopsis sp. CCMEE 29]